MAEKKKVKPKHVPQRTCVGCREVLPKKNLIRLVKTEQGVQIDQSGKLPGRGAYLHDQRSCWVKGLKGSLAKALRTSISEQENEMLTDFLLGLPEVETPETNENDRESMSA
ncbi:MAG: YlxR family protein [Anaerolineaceae bacterium]